MISPAIRARNDRRLTLYEKGYPDTAIAEAEGVTHTAIYYWRQNRGLPRNEQVYPAGDANRLRLYHDGHSDVTIGRLLSIPTAVVTGWRERQGLTGCRKTDMQSRWRRLHAEGFIDREIAEITGVSRDTVSDWRQDHDLPSNGGTGGSSKKITASPRLVLYREGATDSRIALEMRETVASVRRWRKSFGLPANRSTHRRPKLLVDSGILQAIRSLMAGGIAPDVADEAAGDFLLAVAAGDVGLAQAPSLAGRYRKRAYQRYAYPAVARSLDEEIGTKGDGIRLVDVIRDDRSSSWLEEMGATVW